MWMAGPGNAAPVIIKRKKIIQGGGHHGGAWKVAYADFVTAMMAFFLLMWLLNATTEKQRKGISDYFNPTIPVNRISGGGDGAFGGNSVFSEETMAHTGTGAMDRKTAAAADGSGGDAGKGAAGDVRAQSELENVEKALLARGGESNTMKQLLRHVVTRVTDEGLVIELFDLPDAPLFDEDMAKPTPALLALSDLLADVLNLTTNEVAVSGYLRAHPVTPGADAAHLGLCRPQACSGRPDRHPQQPDRSGPSAAGPLGGIDRILSVRPMLSRAGAALSHHGSEAAERRFPNDDFLLA
jgi:chemotaxis protein MotB